MQKSLRLLVPALLLGVLGLAAAEQAEEVSFERLGSYEYKEETAAQPSAAGIPESVRQLNNREVSIGGFMLPLRFDKGRAREFLLLKDQNACCFGKMPRINEWVLVRAEPEGIPVAMDVPILCRGKIKVGPTVDGGVLVGLYLMENPTVTVQGSPRTQRMPMKKPVGTVGD